MKIMEYATEIVKAFVLLLVGYFLSEASFVFYVLVIYGHYLLTRTLVDAVKDSYGNPMQLFLRCMSMTGTLLYVIGCRILDEVNRKRNDSEPSNAPDMQRRLTR